MGALNLSVCPRGQDDRCCPLGNVVSDGAETFVCVGYNRRQDRHFAQARFTHCWKGADYLHSAQFDRRDLLDTVAAISRALSIDEQHRVCGEISDDQMSEADTIEMERAVMGQTQKTEGA